jgi:hypothetical protein
MREKFKIRQTKYRSKHSRMRSSSSSGKKLGKINPEKRARLVKLFRGENLFRRVNFHIFINFLIISSIFFQLTLQQEGSSKKQEASSGSNEAAKICLIVIHFIRRRRNPRDTHRSRAWRGGCKVMKTRQKIKT